MLGTRIELKSVLNRNTMNKIIVSILFILIATVAFADGIQKDKKSSKIHPTLSLSLDTNSFEVSGLKACVGEFEDEDAIDEFIEVLSNLDTTLDAQVEKVVVSEAK